MMIAPTNPNKEFEGILLINKPKGLTSFGLVARLRRHLGIKKIGHAGTLDPLATGVMVMLIGRDFTRLSDKFLATDKEYLAKIHLGQSTDTYDSEGKITSQSDRIPSEQEVIDILLKFQGEIDQIPPMFSAKKRNGKKLYELARKGIEVDRPSQKVNVKTLLIHYQYPELILRISCSKGTYIRSIANDLGIALHCGAHLIALERVRSGIFELGQCLDGTLLDSPSCNADFLSKSIFRPSTY